MTTADISSPARTPRAWLFPLLAAVLIVTWSSGFVGIRFATAHASPFMVLFWRCLVSGVLLLPFALLTGPRIPLRGIAEQSLFGVLTMFVYLAGFSLAIAQKVPTGLVALIADLVPLMIAALSWPVLGHRLSARQWLGTLIGFIGVLIVSSDSLRMGEAPLPAYLLAIGGMVSFAIATVLQKKMMATRLPTQQGLCIQCLSAAFMFGICVLWSEGSLMPPADASFAIGIAWLVLLATFICYTVYYLCLRLYPAARVGSVIYLSPPVTMLWAAAMFGEPLTAMMFAGLAVTLAGVYLAAAAR